MSTASDAPLADPNASIPLPKSVLLECKSLLANGEKVLAWFQPNLSAELKFGIGFVVLTNRALISKQPVPRNVAGTVQRWAIDQVRTIKKIDRAGLGILEVLGSDRLLQAYKFTASNGNAAGSLVAQFKLLEAGQSISSDFAPSVCPSCGGAMVVGQSMCVNCAPTAVPDTGKSLWRLTRFAKPRLNMILLGFLLTILSAAAALIPINLIGPLVDNVLIPHQTAIEKNAVTDLEITRSNFSQVPWYLGGMFLFAILSWLLSWAKTFVLARVSEQISADLRNATYTHLQKLSLEYFGGKRTGDLISRISSDTQRICDFLSISVLDFITDVVMILVTTVWLFRINPMLALVGLLPFPLIAWSVSRVQSKIRMGFARGASAWAEMVNVLADTIPGIRVVKAFAQEHREVGRFRQSNDFVLEANNRVNRLWAAFSPVITLMTDLGLLVVWCYGVYGIYTGSVTLMER